MQNLKIENLLFRSWYYFRLGYSTYLAFPLGYGSTLVTIYYLAIRNVPGLQELFPKFLMFGVISTVVAVPLSVLIGWVHMKKSGALLKEVEVSAEANPYNYKLPPGIVREVQFPYFKEVLIGMREVLGKEGLLDSSTSKRIEGLLQNVDLLIQGGYVGKPRRKSME